MSDYTAPSSHEIDEKFQKAQHKESQYVDLYLTEDGTLSVVLRDDHFIRARGAL